MGFRQQWTEWGFCEENHTHHHHQPGGPASPKQPRTPGRRTSGGQVPVYTATGPHRHRSPHRHSSPRPFSTTSLLHCAGLWSLWQRELGQTVSNTSSKRASKGLQPSPYHFPLKSPVAKEKKVSWESRRVTSPWGSPKQVAFSSEALSDFVFPTTPKLAVPATGQRWWQIWYAKQSHFSKSTEWHKARKGEIQPSCWRFCVPSCAPLGPMH